MKKRNCALPGIMSAKSSRKGAPLIKPSPMQNNDISVGAKNFSIKKAAGKVASKIFSKVGLNAVAKRLGPLGWAYTAVDFANKASKDVLPGNKKRAKNEVENKQSLYINPKF